MNGNDVSANVKQCRWDLNDDESYDLNNHCEIQTVTEGAPPWVCRVGLGFDFASRLLSTYRELRAIRRGIHR